MKAEKGNKVYNIAGEVERKKYQDAGFDIISDDGDIIGYGRGKSVSRDEYEKAKSELATVKAELEAAKNEKPKDKNDEAVKKILTAFSCEHGIDLGNAKSVAGIVKKIEEGIPDMFKDTETSGNGNEG